MKKILVALLALAMCVCCLGGMTAMALAEENETPAAKIVTVADMLENKDRLLPAFNHPGAERLSVVNGVISPWADTTFLYGEEIDGVDLDILITEGNEFSFTLRATAGGQCWTGNGYSLYILGTAAQIHKAGPDGGFGTNQLGGITIPDLFDGEYHNILFSAIDREDGSGATITVNIDGTTQTFEDTGAPLTKEGTEFKIVKANSPVQYVVGRPLVAEEDGDYTVNYVTAHDMMANREQLVPALSETTAKLNVANGVISAWENGQFYYKSKGIDAVDFTVQVTDPGTGTGLAFALRSKENGVMWNSTGYFVYYEGTTATLFKVDDPASWNTKALATVSNLPNILDGAAHNIKFYAVTDSLDQVQLGLTVDGGSLTKAVDRQDVIAGDDTYFKILIVNSATAEFTVTFPENTEHMFGETETVLPTCTEKGCDRKICTACDYTVIENETDALGHDYAETVTKPDCTSGGFTTHTCSRCNDEYRDNETPSLGHNWEAQNEAATCTEAGRTYEKCSRCDAERKEEAIAALGHDWKDHGEAATCTEAGKTWQECDRCHTKQNEQDVVATGHDWKEKNRVEATKEADGYIEYECETCKQTRRETIVYEGPAGGCKSQIGGATSLAAVLVTAGIVAVCIRKTKKEN